MRGPSGVGPQIAPEASRSGFEEHTAEVRDVLKETLNGALDAREKIFTFNERVDGALKRALKFNHLMRRRTSRAAPWGVSGLQSSTGAPVDQF